MTTVYIVLSVVLGACFGSFLNVIIYRLPRKESIVFPASHCPHCQAKIKPYHNIPFLSYIFLGGKCAYCGAEISIRYFFVELLTAFSFFIVLFANSYTLDWVLLRNIIFFLFGIAIIFIDFKHYIIPDVLSLPLLAVGIVFAFLCDEPVWWSALCGGAIGFALFYAIAWSYYKMRNEVGLGGGDIKYIAGIGVFVGIAGLLFVLFVSALIALIVIVFKIIGGKEIRNDTLDSRDSDVDMPSKPIIPFAPFLTIAAFIYILLGEKLLDKYLSIIYSIY